MTCLAAGDLSQLEILEQRLSIEPSLSLLAEIERELLYLRSEVTAPEWQLFCQDFSKRQMFSLLRAQANLLSAWEDSLPSRRSLRERKTRLSREIAEVLGAAVKPRILILGGSRQLEAEDLFNGSQLYHVQFVSVDKSWNHAEVARATQRREYLRLEEGDWTDFTNLRSKLGYFDLIYSPTWLDSCEDAEAGVWLASGVEMLRTGGRLVSANFTPGSRDAGWTEACWSWHPHYRSEEQLAQLTMGLNPAGLRGHAVFRDESGASAFLEIYSI